MLDFLYWAISWILLEWHSLWHLAFRGASFLGTSWEWILAIVFLVLTIRGILFPVFVKQIKSQRAMQAIAPQIKELQAKHKGDRETLQREMMELYRKEKANPLMGCLPMLVQIPVFLSLFHVLRHLRPNLPQNYKTLYGWTAAQFDSASHAKLFGAPISASFRSSPKDLALVGASGTNVKVVAAVLIATMIVTTFLTSRQMIRKTGWAEDPQQKMVQRLMLYGIPFSLLISGVAFPLGVVLYWTTTNLFSLGQQFWVLRKYPPPKTTGKATSATAKVGGSAAKPGGKAGGKAPAGRPEPSAAAKALAPKVGAKPVKKTASPGLQARRAAAAKKAASAEKTADGTAADAPVGSSNGAGGPNGATPVNGGTPSDTPPRTTGGKPANSKKGSAARRSSG